MIYSSSSYGNLGKILGQLCVESALNFSTPTSHSSASDLNFTLKSCIFNIVLYNLEPHSDCMWAPGLLAQAVMSQPGQRQLVERTAGAVSKEITLS